MSVSDEHAPSSGEALVPLGYIFAVIVPFVGLILGIIAATRSTGRARRNGPWIIALATVAFALWAGVIYAEVHHSEQAAAQEGARHAREGQGETERQSEDEAEREYCHEHPHAGGHMAGGRYWTICTLEDEEGG
jgi:hypothetical protein